MTTDKSTRMSLSESDLSLITIGAPITYCIGSDRYSGKVTGHTESRKRLVVRLGHEDEPILFSWRAEGGGKYRPMGSKVGSLIVGEAEDYRDPSF